MDHHFGRTPEFLIPNYEFLFSEFLAREQCDENELPLRVEENARQDQPFLHRQKLAEYPADTALTADSDSRRPGSWIYWKFCNHVSPISHHLSNRAGQ